MPGSYRHVKDYIVSAQDNVSELNTALLAKMQR